MIIRLMILLLICGIAVADITFVLGGASSDVYAGGAFDPVQRTVDEAVGVDGATLYSADDTNFADDGSGDIEIEIADGQASSDWVGVYVLFHNSDGSEPAERIVILSVDTSGDPDLIVIDAEYANGSTCDIDVGGAVLNTYGDEGTDEDGKDWDLEGVLDSALGNATSQQVQILIYISSSVAPSAQINIDTNGGAGIFYKRIIGADSGYGALSLGSYSTYDMGVADLGAGASIFSISVPNIRVENIAAMNPDGSGGTPVIGEHCFEVVHTNADNVQFINCKAVRGYYGFEWFNGAGNDADKGALINCYATDCVNRCIDAWSDGFIVKGGLYDWGTAFADNRIIAPRYSTVLDNVIFVGGTRGVQYVAANAIYITNCVFIGQSDDAYFGNNADGRAVVINCIFDLDDVGTETALTYSPGSVTVINCITDVDTEALAGFQTAVGSAYNLTFTNTDPWVNISGGDYRINWGNPIANTYVIDRGFVPYLGANTTGSPKSNLGAFNYQQARPRAIGR